jgi:hypothetical protein
LTICWKLGVQVLFHEHGLQVGFATAASWQDNQLEIKAAHPFKVVAAGRFSELE